MQMGPSGWPRGGGVTLEDFRMPWYPEPRGSDIDDEDDD
jgi:hypothetical protein